MTRLENSELVECIDCGANITSALDRAFALGDDTFLCFECATTRGGIYDDQHDCWLTAPNVADEPDERRPHP